ncbi:MAG: DegV family EDD domain-containing protein [Anaerolineaceae bacterium]|nr:DegV family EDD domain-containing protein [Anaerolineaceae bacterium]
MINSICILTDSTAQFPQLGFPGLNNVRVVSYGIELNGRLFEEGQDLKTNDLPQTANEILRPRLIAPSVEKFRELFTNLGQHYSEIITILSSANLTRAYENAQQAQKSVQGRVRISLIDSQTTSVGLGLLVQTAAETAALGKSALDIERIVRSMIPHTYMMLCTPGLSYLHYAGFTDQAQAFVGEMLGLMPIFTLEEGQISAVEKVRNARGLVDFMQEFILEFDELLHIAFIQSVPGLTHEARLMREHVQNSFSQTPFSEHSINLPLAILIGPRSVGLVVVEKPES